MFYRVTAEESEDIIVLSYSSRNVDRYVSWLNGGRSDKLYAATAVPKFEWEGVEESFDVDLNDPEWNDLPDLGMSAESFIRWAEDMKAAGLAKDDFQCARAIGYRDISDLKVCGGDYRLSLACQAALRGLSPYK